jgi:7-cyano-7-deazaguanine tRNA-ribosyltransferase
MLVSADATMSFEVLHRDLLARIGKLKTKSGSIETPILLPVINPLIQPVQPKTMQTEFGCNALITNAYIIKKHFGNQVVKEGIHKFLDFNGVVMTDSGAYQLLVYGDLELDPEEIVRYQEEINSDIATILDVPTGWKVSRDYAWQTVTETLQRGKQLFKVKKREDILWVGPIQGGQYLELVAESAKEMGKLPFQIHALGSPTAIMEQYFFDKLVDMIMAAKMNMPLERPLHLFGAGHPFMFALVIALGCDLFDSAAYAIFAKEGRYMTAYETTKLKELQYFPCSCPQCVKYNPKDVLDMSHKEQQQFLAKHNLYASFAELKRIKQAIIEGRLWEHLEMRAHSHPALLQAVKKLRMYKDYIEHYSPITKKSGFFYFSSLGLARPEIVRHRKRLLERYSKPKKAKTLVLIPASAEKPFHKSETYRNLLKKMKRKTFYKFEGLHVCFYAAPFGVIPIELDEVYPLSQHETASPFDLETINYVAEQVANYIASTDYEKVILFEDIKIWKRKIGITCRKICARKGIPLEIYSLEEQDKTAK